jgi:hypothetical protein
MPNPRKNLKGKTFGSLTVLRLAKPDNSGNTQWLCQCDCGNETTVRYQHLSTGRTKSCGCSKKSGRSLDPFSGEAFWG